MLWIPDAAEGSLVLACSEGHLSLGQADTLVNKTPWTMDVDDKGADEDGEDDGVLDNKDEGRETMDGER